MFFLSERSECFKWNSIHLKKSYVQNFMLFFFLFQIVLLWAPFGVDIFVAAANAGFCHRQSYETKAVDMSSSIVMTTTITMQTIEWPAYRLLERQCRRDSLLIWHYYLDRGTIPVDLTAFHLNSFAMFAIYPFHLDCFHSLCPYHQHRQHCRRPHSHQMLDHLDLV